MEREIFLDWFVFGRWVAITTLTICTLVWLFSAAWLRRKKRPRVLMGLCFVMLAVNLMLFFGLQGVWGRVIDFGFRLPVNLVPSWGLKVDHWNTTFLIGTFGHGVLSSVIMLAIVALCVEDFLASRRRRITARSS